MKTVKKLRKIEKNILKHYDESYRVAQRILGFFFLHLFSSKKFVKIDVRSALLSKNVNKF